MVDARGSNSPSGGKPERTREPRSHFEESPLVAGLQPSYNWNSLLSIAFAPVTSVRGNGSVFLERNLKAMAGDFVDVIDNLTKLRLSRNEIADIDHYLYVAEMLIAVIEQGPGSPVEIAKRKRNQKETDQEPLYTTVAKLCTETIEKIRAELLRHKEDESFKIDIGPGSELFSQLIKLEKLADRPTRSTEITPPPEPEVNFAPLALRDRISPTSAVEAGPEIAIA